MTRADAALPTFEKDPGVKVTSGQFLRLGDHLQGRILTILEAAFTDKDQLTAVKSLVKNALWDDFSEVTRWMAKGGDVKAEGLSEFPF